MHHRSERITAKNSVIDLMAQISKSKDALNKSEKIIAQKISSDDFLGFDSLNVEEIDDLINLVSNYWDVEEQKAVVFIDMLLEKKHAIETGLP